MCELLDKNHIKILEVNWYDFLQENQFQLPLEDYASSR